MDDPDKIRLLADLTRAEILRLLSDSPMTETQLSKRLGLTKAAVGYHLRLLTEARLIRVERSEPEEHGIMQKYYSPVATVFIVDPDRIPRDARRHFISAETERLIGILGISRLHRRFSKVSTKTLQRLGEALLKQLRDVGKKYVEKKMRENAVSLRVKIYAEALTHLAKREEWRVLFTEAKTP